MIKRSAFGYCRVSSVSQGQEDRDGITRQKTAIRKYAAANGIHIVRWFDDTISGTTDMDNRPKLGEMMTALHANGTRLVLIEKLDRLARDLMIQESIIADLQRSEFELVSVSEPDMCSSEPTRVLLRQMMGAFSQYERSMIVLKLRGAKQRARAKNPDYKEGRKAYGERPGESEIIERIVAMRAADYPLVKIADTLNAEGVKARAGSWYATSVSNVLKRAGATCRQSEHIHTHRFRAPL
jgi:DNA invertase Pin-like site-specific DNA recombinase